MSSAFCGIEPFRTLAKYLMSDKVYTQAGGPLPAGRDAVVGHLPGLVVLVFHRDEFPVRGQERQISRFTDGASKGASYPCRLFQLEHHEHMGCLTAPASCRHCTCGCHRCGCSAGSWRRFGAWSAASPPGHRPHSAWQPSRRRHGANGPNTRRPGSA